MNATKRMALMARGELPPPRKPEVTMAKGVAQVRLYDWIGEAYGGTTATMLAEAIDSAKGARELELYVNSNGGAANEGVAMFNVVSRFQGKKTAYVDGIAASAASVVLLAADERVMMPGAQVMVHGASSIVMGNAAQLRRTADELEALNATIGGIYLTRTGQKQETVDAWLASDETYFDGPQAVEAGLATRVAEATNAAPKTISMSAGISPLDLARLRQRAASKISGSRAF